MSPESKLMDAEKREPQLVASWCSADFPFSHDMLPLDETAESFEMYEDDRDYELGEGD
jgi:hypothetical protein